MDPLLLGLIGIGAYFLLKKKEVPPVAPPITPPVLPPRPGPGSTIPPELWERIHNTIKNETNLDKLRELRTELEAHKPRTPEIGFALTILNAKINALESGKVKPPDDSTKPKNDLPKSLADMLAKAIQALTLQPDGSISGPVTDEAIQRATSVAGQLDTAGYTVLANTLRQYIELARTYLPKKPDITPKPPDIPPDLWNRIQEMIRLERDPKRLRELLAEMQSHRPETPQMNEAIVVLKTLIAQIEASNATIDGINKVDDIIPKTDIPPDDTPTVPEEKTKANKHATNLVLHLKNLQNKYGMPGAKGKEDKTLVKNFQSSENLGQDGKPGPGTMLRVAAYEADLPLVMYWPTSATKKNVLAYRDALLTLANASSGSRASELRASAERERGQGGIVGAF